MASAWCLSAPLARGVLTGKYKLGEEPEANSRAGRKDARLLATEWRPESLEIAQRIVAYATSRSTTASVLAIHWVLRNKSVSSVIAGPKAQDQWSSYLDALNYEYTAEDEAFLSALVPAGHNSTPSYIDPVYPVEGRVLRQ